MVTKDDFRGGMARFATGVTIVTTLDHQGSLHGMTANSFTSVSLTPPLALVCVAFHTHTHEYIKSLGAFGVNVLSQEQQEIGAYFARKPQDRIGSPFTHRISEMGLPIIEGSMAYFGCRVVDAHVHGDHTIYIGSVDEMSLGEKANPLLYYESNFTNLNHP